MTLGIVRGASDLPYLGPPFGGTSTAVLGMVDVAIASHVTVGGEMSLASAITGMQSQRASGGTNAFVSDHRDSVFSGTLKVGMPLSAPIRAAFVIGGGLAHVERHGSALSVQTGLRSPSIPSVSRSRIWCRPTPPAPTSPFASRGAFRLSRSRGGINWSTMVERRMASSKAESRRRSSGSASAGNSDSSVETDMRSQFT